MQNRPLTQAAPKLLLALVGVAAQGAEIEAVVASSAGLPVPSAIISLRGQGLNDGAAQLRRHAKTDARGRVRFGDLPGGYYYQLFATKAGHLAASDIPGVRVEDEQAEHTLSVTLRRRPVVTGRVNYADGRPARGANVQLYRERWQGGAAYLEVSGANSADDRGIYRVAVREAGRYWVRASHQETVLPFGSAPFSTGVVFAPNSPDLEAAKQLSLAFDSEETPLDIALPWAPDTAIAAQIISGQTGAECRRCSWTLWRIEGRYFYQVANGGGPRGLSLAGIPSGPYRIYVYGEGEPSWYGLAETTLVEGRPTELTVTTQPPAEISGRVKLVNPPQEVLQAADNPRITLHLEPVGQPVLGMPNPSHAELESGEREFLFGAAPPERFLLRTYFSGAAPAYLAGISRQGEALSSPLLDLSSGGSWSDLELQFRFDPAIPSVRVDGGTDEGDGHSVLLMPDPETNRFGYQARLPCGSRSECYGAPVAPGRYFAVAVPTSAARRLDVNDENLKARLRSVATPVRLSPGENPPIRLPVLSPSEIQAH